MKLIIAFFALLTASGCSKYIHLYQTQPSSNTSNLRSYFENDTMRIDYNLWAENGRVSFLIYNKLSVPMYIDWKKSSFVKNDEKNNYFEQISKTTGVHTTRVVGLAGDMKTSGETISSTLEQISFIPPRSAMRRTQFIIKPGVDLRFKSGQNTFLTSGDGSKQVKVLHRLFREEKSPVTLRNFMTLSTDDKFTTSFYIDNGFYVSDIFEMKFKEFTGNNPVMIESSKQQSPFRSNSNFFMFAAKPM